MFRDEADAELVVAVAWETNDVLLLQQHLAPLFGSRAACPALALVFG